MKYLILILTLSSIQSVLAQDNKAVVGHVAMSIGEVEIIRSNGQRSSAQRRSEVMEGDILETGTNGALHIRFIDRALVSISCRSKMIIQQYNAGNNEIVELSLVEGSIRSITGTISPTRYTLHTDSADVRITQSSADFRVSEEISSGSSFSVFDGGITVKNNFGALDLGINGNFDFAEAGIGLPPIGLAIAPTTMLCD